VELNGKSSYAKPMACVVYISSPLPLSLPGGTAWQNTGGAVSVSFPSFTARSEPLQDVSNKPSVPKLLE